MYIMSCYPVIDHGSRELDSEGQRVSTARFPLCIVCRNVEAGCDTGKKMLRETVTAADYSVLIMCDVFD